MDTFNVSAQTEQPKDPGKLALRSGGQIGHTIRFLRIQDVSKLTTLSKSFIYKLQANGQFPKSFQIAPKVSVWTADSVREWMQAQLDKAA